MDEKLQESIMVIDAFTISGAIITLLLIAATLLAVGCCKKGD